MRKITVENYRVDKYYPRVVHAVDAILSRGHAVAPIDVFIAMDLLDAEAVADWRSGRVLFLENVIRCNLSAANRVLRVLRMHAHDLRLRESMTAYRRSGRGPKTLLRFSKSGDRPVEDAYGRHFVVLKSAKQVQSGPLPGRAPRQGRPSCSHAGGRQRQALGGET